jgi:hypothetical protein
MRGCISQILKIGKFKINTYYISRGKLNSKIFYLHLPSCIQHSYKAFIIFYMYSLFFKFFIYSYNATIKLMRFSSIVLALKIAYSRQKASAGFVQYT